jgi:hypothetical protein
MSTLLFSGCAVKRGEVSLNVPQAATPAAPAALNGKEVYVNSISDQRVFELKPAQPNIPSLDPSAPQDETTKSRAVGRKRNGYGMALADILLSNGQTVPGIIQKTLEEAFQEQGYLVLHDKTKVSPQTYLVDATIQQFWSWMNMGFWALTISCEIETNVTMHKEGFKQTYPIHVKAADSFQTGMESNYIEMMQKALQAYSADVKKEIK